MREKEREQYKPTTVVCNEKNGYIMPCFSYAAHRMSELALIMKKITKSFDHSEFFFMHWTN